MKENKLTAKDVRQCWYRFIKYSKQDFDKFFKLSENKKDGILLMYRIFSVMSNCFSVREKLKIYDKGDTVFHGLKRYYNILKHKYSLKTILNNAVVEENKELVFPTIERLKFKDENKFYNKHVKGKSIKTLIELLYVDTYNNLFPKK